MEEESETVNSKEIISCESEMTLAKLKEKSRKERGDCEVSASTSHTQFFKKARHEPVYNRITTDEYFGKSESLSTSDTFHCVHGKAGKQYTQKGLLKRNLLKELDPIKTDPKWTETCKPTAGWDLVETVEFLVQDPTVGVQRERLEMHLKDLNVLTKHGYRVDVLHSMCTILDYLVESSKDPTLFQHLSALLENMEKSILLKKNSDIATYFDSIRNYFGFMGYLLLRLESDELFALVSKAIIFHLSASDSIRSQGAARLHPCLRAAAPVLIQSVVRMIAVSTSQRFPTFATLALLLACDSMENCLELMKENIIENIFYRFNPYFPERPLFQYEVNPADPQDINVKLGDSSVNLQITLSLLLVLLRTTIQYINEDPKYRVTLPSPDCYAQRCFLWAYRYECRAHHGHQRVTLTLIAHALLHCFRRRLLIFCTMLMPDVMSLSVLTEIPPRRDWTDKVRFDVFQMDVYFKKILISLSIEFIKICHENIYMVESRHWLLGLAYLIDPGLSSLRFKWATTHYSEIRKTSLQALVCTLSRMPAQHTKTYGIIRRVMWYIEWYSLHPFELSTLYWCVRLLHVSLNNRGTCDRFSSVKDLFDTHGVIILVHLCYTLLEQKLPPLEKSQIIISLCLRVLTSCIEQSKYKIECCVYTHIKWPHSIGHLSKKILNIALYSLERHFIISDRWLIAILNFIWEGVIWNPENRLKFIKNDGIYKLLDIITMTKPPVQCIALALICDATRSGDAVGQLVTWRAGLCATNASPKLVQRGATIATLLAAVFRDECKANGVRLDYNGVIEDLDLPIMSSELRKQILNVESLQMENRKTPISYVACDVAGSRLSKAFAILHMLSEDLESKVNLADEAYKLYKNIKLAPEDETILVLCSNYLTLKLSEVWVETEIQSPGLLAYDEDTLSEFLQIGKGWAKEIKKQQMDMLEKDRKKDYDEEYSLYAFLGRVRLNVALDALRQVRCVARSADRWKITHAMLHDAVCAHHRRSDAGKKLNTTVLQTYRPKLDHNNLTGQFVKVKSIVTGKMPNPRQVLPSGSAP